jgi:serine/threonine protein kinase
MNLSDIINAKSPEEVFGKVADAKALKKEFFRLSKIAHPDKNGNSLESEKAFNMLVVWMERAEYKLSRGTYGNADALPNSITITSKKGSYYIVDLIKAGDLANVYSALDTKDLPVALKITRSPSNNDLGRNEVSVIKKIEETCGNLPAFAHVPKIQDSFQVSSDRVQKQVNVFSAMESQAGWYTVEQILEQYPEGLDLRDAAWMFNRLLGALLMAHQAGYVHAAVVPSHLMLHLPTHNGVLLDWSYAVPEGSNAKAVSPEMEPYLPPEILKREPLTFGTDLYMAAQLLVRLVGGEENLPEYPPSARGLFRACRLAKTKRINDVSELYEDFNSVLKILYGPRTFRAFEMKA